MLYKNCSIPYFYSSCQVLQHNRNKFRRERENEVCTKMANYNCICLVNILNSCNILKNLVKTIKPVAL